MSAVLVVAAHPDDEVLGCGGTIARLAAEGCPVHVLLLADGESARMTSSPPSSQSARIAARRAAAEQALDMLGGRSVTCHGFPDNRMDTVPLLDVIRVIEESMNACRPSMVLTHHRGDVNIDHQIVHDAVLAACRPQASQPGGAVRQLLFFEVPSSTEWRPPHSAEAFHPNWFVDISDTLERKLRAMEAYRNEMRDAPHPRSPEAIRALATWRGATAGVAAAEAFMLGRAVQ